VASTARSGGNRGKILTITFARGFKKKLHPQGLGTGEKKKFPGKGAQSDYKNNPARNPSCKKKTTKRILGNNKKEIEKERARLHTSPRTSKHPKNGGACGSVVRKRGRKAKMRQLHGGVIKYTKRGEQKTQKARREKELTKGKVVKSVSKRVKCKEGRKEDCQTPTWKKFQGELLWPGKIKSRNTRFKEGYL